MNSIFDLLLWNKATKDYYFIKGLRDSSITTSNITGVEINTTLSCYCKVQDDGHYQIVPFSLMKYDGRFHIFLTMFKPSENVWRRYDISADTWENIVYSQSLTITYTILNNGQ